MLIIYHEFIDQKSFSLDNRFMKKDAHRINNLVYLFISKKTIKPISINLHFSNTKSNSQLIFVTIQPAQLFILTKVFDQNVS